MTPNETRSMRARARAFYVKDGLGVAVGGWDDGGRWSLEMLQ